MPEHSAVAGPSLVLREGAQESGAGGWAMLCVWTLSHKEEGPPPYITLTSLTVCGLHIGPRLYWSTIRL